MVSRMREREVRSDETNKKKEQRRAEFLLNRKNENGELSTGSRLAFSASKVCRATAQC